MGIITITDYILLPFYLFVIYLAAYSFRNTRYPEGHPWRAYFIPGLTLKIVGAIFIGMLYEYYYKGGDTLFIYLHSKIINSAMDESFGTWFRLITHQADPNNLVDSYYLSKMFWYDDVSTYTVACIGAAIGTLCFSKFLLIAVVLASFAFTGVWAMFKTFAEQYPGQVKYIAFAVLFLPGTILWGSALFKDTICMFGISWILYFFYSCIEKGQFKFGVLLLFLSSVIFLILIKVYIILAFLPFLFLKTVLVKMKVISNKLIRRFIFLMIIFMFAISALYISRYAQKAILKYSIENIATTAKVTSSYLLAQSEKTNGSGYNLGDFEPTVQGIFKKTLPAINVTLFRPYLWESRKPIVFLASLESFLVLLFTLKVLFTIKPGIIFQRIMADPNISFCLLFSLLFAFFVGISSYNFGTLSRYKIPCMPFYLMFLILVSRIGIKDKTPEKKTLD